MVKMSEENSLDVNAYIECSTNWENLDSRNVSAIIQCSMFDTSDDESLSAMENEDDLSTDQNSILLRPFVDPEQTEASRCELRILARPHIHKRIAKVVVRSTARNIEVYDRMGEYQLTAKGERNDVDQVRWYTSVFHVKPECAELVLKFLSLSETSVLRLQSLHLLLAPSACSGDPPGPGVPLPLPGGGLDLGRVQELTNFGESLSPSARQILDMMAQQRVPQAASAGPRAPGGDSLPAALLSSLLAGQHLSTAGARSPDASGNHSTSSSAGPPPRWLGQLEQRLEAMEARITARLDAICLRLDAIEARAAAPTGLSSDE